MNDIVVEIRGEQSADYEAICEVHKQAFGSEAEPRLVELLRSRKKVAIALVALSEDRILGHIVFSPIVVAEAPEDFRGIGLGPVAVLPEFQNRGVGSKLIRAGLHVCRESGYEAVIVLGHTKYYPRFGFHRAKEYGLASEYNAPDNFMAMELKEGVLQKINGLVKYAPEFREVGC